MTTTSSDLKSYLAALSGLVDERDALAAQVASLTAQVNAQKPKFKMIVGASTPDPALGTLPIERTYSSGGCGTAPTQPTVYSFKQFDQAAVTAFVKAAPKGQVICYFHEPEDNLEAKSLDINVWHRNTLALLQTVKDCGRVGEVIPTCIFMGWSLFGRPAGFLDQFLVADVVKGLKDCGGILGFDRYSGTKTGAKPTITPVQMFKALADMAASLGLPWGIFETGTTQDNTTVDAEHAAWWQGVFDYLRSGAVAAPRYFIAWNPADREYAIQKLPQVAAVWKAQMAR